MEGQQKFSTDSDKEVLDNHQLMSIAVIGNERKGRQVAMVIPDTVEKWPNVWQAIRSDSPMDCLYSSRDSPIHRTILQVNKEPLILIL